MATQRHLINQGQVFCPVRGTDTDVERCLGCRLLEDMDLDSRSPWVKCEIPVLLEPQRRSPVPA